MLIHFNDRGLACRWGGEAGNAPFPWIPASLAELKGIRQKRQP
jgi:hypothetical protein